MILSNVLRIQTSGVADTLRITLNYENASDDIVECLRDLRTGVTGHLILYANSRISSYEFVESLRD